MSDEGDGDYKWRERRGRLNTSRDGDMKITGRVSVG